LLSPPGRTTVQVMPEPLRYRSAASLWSRTPPKRLRNL